MDWARKQVIHMLLVNVPTITHFFIDLEQTVLKKTPAHQILQNE
jgi:hypothetical protein